MTAADTTIPSALTLRGVTYSPALFCAPMAGITHSAFRRLLSDFGGYGALFTEMLSAKMIVHENPHKTPWLRRRPQEGKVLYQLMVTDTFRLPEIIARLAPLQPDGLDLNSACSAPKVCFQGGGADLFDDGDRLRAVVRVMRQHFAGPLSVKIRLGAQRPDWKERLRERLHMLEDEGVDALTLHPRFARESLNRTARHDLYGELIALTRLPVIANGDITGATFIRERAPQFAGAAGLMMGRMAAAQPWIFAQWHDPDCKVELADVWRRLCAYIQEDFPPDKALIRLKILTPYFARNFLFGHTLFLAVQNAPDLATALRRADEFLAASPAVRRHVSVDGLQGSREPSRPAPILTRNSCLEFILAPLPPKDQYKRGGDEFGLGKAMNMFPGYVDMTVVQQGETFSLYRAVESATRADVLIKVPVSPRARGDLPTPLENEFGLQAKLDPSWAIRPLRMEPLPDGDALVLEAFDGIPLDAVPVPLGVEEVLTLAKSIAGAVAAMHAQGIVHKDLKPSNILVSEGRHPPTCRLTGFSIAVHLGGEAQPPRHPDRIEGTLAYMSPEQTGRLNRAVDHRSDLYSLGVVLYRMLTGNLPCEGDDVLGWVLCHVAVQPQPPSARNPAIPGMVSDIVMKLLAKDADDRYQTAAGLGADLERCLTAWRATGRIEPFPLGVGDVSDRFLLPQRLYGRERESQALQAAYARVAATGAPMCVMVSGYAGIGKTALVQQLYARVLQDRGFLLTGKFEQFKRDIPYATLIQSFRPLVQQLLTGDETQLAAWRRELQAALGVNGQLLVETIPELALVIGPQPEVVPLPPSEARNRFHLLVRHFLGVFARPARPLVLFLDDLQWIDASSLALLAYLVTQAETRHVLLLGAYRANEVSPTHPLPLTLAEFRKAGVALQDIVLGPLGPPDLRHLIADSLRDTPARIAPLAELVATKTGGNPFFLLQFMKGLHQEGLLHFDRQAVRWAWTLGDIAAKDYTDNVVEFLVGKLRLLPAPTRRVLQRFAATGNRSTLPLLASICERSPSRLEAELRPAVEQGLLRWRDDTVEFIHDRVQQAAYALLPPEERPALHLQIGRLLRARFAGDAVAEYVFEIVSQFNLAHERIVTPDERREVAELNLLAGRKAKASTAYPSALAYLTSGLALLPAESWGSHYAVAFGLHVETAECEWLRGNLAEAHRLFLQLLDRGEVGRMDRARIYRDLIEVNTAQGLMHDAIHACRECLALFGQDLPATPTREQMQEAYDAIWQALGTRQIETLLDLPRLADREVAATMEAMAATIPAAVFTSETFLGLLLSRMVLQSIRHGNGESSLAGYIYFGMIAGQTFGNYQVGYRFGKLAYDLVDRGFLTWKSRVLLIFGNVINFWTRHMRTDLPYIHEAFAAGLELGDLANACYCCNHLITAMLATGLPLHDVHDELGKRMDFVRKAHYDSIVDILTSQQRFILNMQGRTSSFSSFSDADFDAQAFEARIGKSQMALLPFWHGVLKLQARVFSGDFKEAIAAGHAVKDLLWTSPSHIENAQFAFYYALALAAGYPQLPEQEQDVARGTLEAHRVQLQGWAELCPDNFQHKHDLLAAESARLAGRALEAEDLYERAIRGAGERKFVHEEGLACERASVFYRDRGFERIADTYLREARHCYLRWGADGKARQLEHQYPQLGPRPSRLLDQSPLQATLATQTSQLDLLAVIKASQAVAGEIVLPRLLDTLLTIVMESAGASRAYLLMTSDHDITLAAEASVMDGRISIRHEPHPEGVARLPQAIINYVMRTRDPVRVDDTAQPGPFADAFGGDGGKSALCLPIVKQDKLIAILYLAHDQLTGVFTPDRLAFLELLATQSAISLENALLYTEMDERTAALRVSEEKLRSLFGTMMDAYVKVDMAGQLLEFNLAYQSMLGYTADELRSLTYADLTPPPWRASEERIVAEQVLPRGFSDVYEKEYRRKDGTVFPVELRTFLLRDARGQPAAMWAIVRDITARKKAEMELSASEERYRFLVEGSNEIFFYIHDCDNCFRYLSPSIANVLGYPAEELLAQPFTLLLAEGPQQAHVIEQTDRALASGIASPPYEAEVLNRDGQRRTLAIVESPVLRDGQVVGMQGMARDITARKRAEEALRERENLLTVMGRMAKVGGYEVDAATGKVMATPEVYAIYEVDPAEFTLTVENGIRFYAPSARPLIDEAWRKAVGRGEPFDLELEFVTARGNLRWVRSLAQPIMEDGKITRVTGTFQDITDRKRMEQELRQLNETLEQRVRERTLDLEATNKELEAFSYSASHDLRTPLRILDGFSQAILEDYQDKLDDTGRKYLSFIRQGAQQMAALIDDMLRLGRIGRTEMHVEDINLSEMAAALAGTLGQQDPARRVEWRIAPGLHVAGDRPLMEIALNNLLSNAWKFTGLREAALIEVGETRVDHEWAIFIRDNGAGFDMAYASKLFAPFQRLHSPSEFPGTGIGLAIAQRIIQRHGGRIWAEGAKGQGATFYFTHPTRRT